MNWVVVEKHIDSYEIFAILSIEFHYVDEASGYLKVSGLAVSRISSRLRFKHNY